MKYFLGNQNQGIQMLLELQSQTKVVEKAVQLNSSPF